MWRLVLAVSLLCAWPALAAPKRGASSAAAAKDTKAPTITHEQVKEHDGKTPIVIEAKIDDDKSGVFEPTLLVRAAGTGHFQRISMTLKAGDVYTATIPAELLDGDIEYLLEAFDQTGNGPTRIGDENAPMKIVRNAPADKPPDAVASTSASTSTSATSSTTSTTSSSTTPANAATPEDSGPSGAVIALGVVAGVVVVAAAVAGGGYAYYALRPPVPSTIAIAVKGPSPL